ncbi:hypothetical protein AAG570_001383 [Ranatra chinensis]|uniref:Uncharacterized protein n=1 Tax=Ranatra chinensis TaxID=642074 RepID=A0ABD0YQH9_9HEMI
MEDGGAENYTNISVTAFTFWKSHLSQQVVRVIEDCLPQICVFNVKNNNRLRLRLSASPGSVDAAGSSKYATAMPIKHRLTIRLMVTNVIGLLLVAQRSTGIWRTDWNRDLLYIDRRTWGDWLPVITACGWSVTWRAEDPTRIRPSSAVEYPGYGERLPGRDNLGKKGIHRVPILFSSKRNENREIYDATDVVCNVSECKSAKVTGNAGGVTSADGPAGSPRLPSISELISEHALCIGLKYNDRDRTPPIPTRTALPGKHSFVSNERFNMQPLPRHK